MLWLAHGSAGDEAEADDAHDEPATLAAASVATASFETLRSQAAGLALQLQESDSRRANAEASLAQIQAANGVAAAASAAGPPAQVQQTPLPSRHKTHTGSILRASSALTSPSLK